MANQMLFEGSGNGYVIVSPTGDARTVRTQAFSTGEATHVGKYSLVAREVLDLESLAVTEGSFTLTTSNGDTISGTFAGSGTPGEEPGVIVFNVSGPVTAGVGRFAEVSGDLTFTGVADLATGELSENISGILSTSRSLAMEQDVALVTPNQEDFDERLD